MLKKRCNSSATSATSATSLAESLESCKILDKNRRIKPQVDMLVCLWQENIGVLESNRCYEIWDKIKTAPDSLAPAKAI